MPSSSSEGYFVPVGVFFDSGVHTSLMAHVKERSGLQFKSLAGEIKIELGYNENAPPPKPGQNII